MSLSSLFITMGVSGCPKRPDCSPAYTNQQISGVKGPTVSVVNNSVLVSIVFENISVDGGATIPIPRYPNSTVEVGPDFQSSGTLVTLTISIADFLGNNVNLLPPQSLPGGRPLPTVASGSLPSIALQIPALHNTVLYLGPQAIGFFVPFQLDTGGTIVSFRFYNTSSCYVGTVSLVGADSSGENSGILLLLQTDSLGIPGSAPTS